MSSCESRLRPRRWARALTVAVLAAAVAMGALAGPARADEHGRHRRPPHHRPIRRPPRPVVMGYDAPTYVEAPPPIVYAPPAPPALLSLGINLNLH